MTQTLIYPDTHGLLLTPPAFGDTPEMPLGASVYRDPETHNILGVVVQRGGTWTGTVYPGTTDEQTRMFDQECWGDAAAMTWVVEWLTAECFDCGSQQCDGDCHARAVEQFDRGQM